MQKNTLYILMVALAITLSKLNAQTVDNYEKEEKPRHHQFGVLLGHTHMREGEENNSGKRLSLPSSTLFYNYHLNEKWFLGLHIDFVVENFVAQPISGEGGSVERKKPIAPAIMGGFKPGKHFSFLVGGGIDTDKEETLALIRFDTEYGLDIARGWEFVATFGYDLRINAFDSFQLGVGMSKNL